MADQDYVWSTVLESKKPYEWNPENFPKEEDTTPQHKLVMKYAILSPTASAGETVAIELETKGFGGSTVKTLVAVLVAGTVHQTALNISLRDEPVKLSLAKGSGPVHLVGIHQVTFPDAGDSSDHADDSSDSEESSDEDDDAEEEEEEEEAKPEVETPVKKEEKKKEVEKKEVEKKDADKKDADKKDTKKVVKEVKKKKDDKKDTKKEEKKEAKA